MSATEKFGHYQVQKREDGSLFELGRGSMGITYKAFDTSLGFSVCLKVINSTYLNSEVARLRFIREARSAAKLRHRNVASVFHLGTEEETWFYAMEFIDGETLEAVIKREGTLAPRAALEITAQVARALNAATQHGLVHRDIKPANLMLVKEDDEMVVKVIDFGLVKSALGVAGDDAATLSLGEFVGTPHFASPEQWEGRGTDIRSDIYSLGVTLWYMLTGEIPFSGSATQVMTQHLSKPPPFEKLKGTPAPMADILRKMLAKDPAERFQTPSELRKAIEAALTEVGISAASLAPSADAIEPQEDFAYASCGALDDTVTDAQSSNFKSDDDLQFTVFRPEEVPLNSWRDLLAFAHLTSKRSDAPADEPDPIAEVERQARQFLGDELEHYRKLSQDGTVAFPRDGEITFEPELEHAEFNPARVTFRWKESVHREAFRFRVLEGAIGSHSRGRLNVFLGPFLAATVPLRIKIVDRVGNTPPKATKRQTAAAYRNIFVSYSHRDQAIVDICQHYAKAFGDRFLRDCVDLRTGQKWNPKLLALIEEADVFQLFWSSSASNSKYVRQEVAHALKLDREGFIRPTYWGKDLPSPWSSDPDISTLHFERLPFGPDVGSSSRDKRKTKAVRHLATIASVLLVFAGAGGFELRQHFLQRQQAAEDSEKTHGALPIDRQYRDACKLLASGDASRAAEAFRELGKKPGVNQPLLDWVSLHAGLAELLAGQNERAMAHFKEIEARGAYSPDPAEKKLANFFLETARVATSDEQIPLSTKQSLDGSTYEALALLIFAVRNWNQGRLETASSFFRQFVSSSPQERHAWVADYKPIASSYIADLKSLQLATEASDDASTLSAKKEALQVVRQLKAGLKFPDKLDSHFASLENKLRTDVDTEEARVARSQEDAPDGKALADAARRQAEEDAADGKALADAKAKLTLLEQQFKFTDAAAVAAAIPVTGAKGKVERDALLKAADWLAKFKRLLILDITSIGYPAPIVKRNGAQLPAGAHRANDEQVEVLTPFGSLSALWTDISFESMYAMGHAFLKTGVPQASLADREWYLGVFAIHSGRLREGRELLVQASQAKEDYRDNLKLFIEAPTSP